MGPIKKAILRYCYGQRNMPIDMEELYHLLPLDAAMVKDYVDVLIDRGYLEPVRRNCTRITQEGIEVFEQTEDDPEAWY